MEIEHPLHHHLILILLFYSTPSFSKQNESQTFKVKRSQVSYTKENSNKTQSFMTQRGKAHIKKA